MRGSGDFIALLRAAVADLGPRTVPQVLERHRAVGTRCVRRNSQRDSRARSSDLARNERRAAGLRTDRDARGGKSARERNVVRAALTGDRRRSVMRGIGDNIALLRAAVADLGPRAVPQVFERHRAVGTRCVRRNSQRDSRARSSDLARNERRAATRGADIHARGGKDARKRDAVCAATGRNRCRSVVRGVGDGITRLRTAVADLSPRAVYPILEHHRADIIALVGRNRQLYGRTGSRGLALRERLFLPLDAGTDIRAADG